MTNPLHTLRDALGEVEKLVTPLSVDRYFCTKCCGIKPESFIHGGQAVCACGYCMGTIKPHADAVAAASALTRAESALRELERVQKQVSAEAEPRYTAEQFFDALDEELELDKLDPLYSAYREATKRRLAERGEKNG